MSRLTTTTFARISTATGIRAMSRRRFVDSAKTLLIVVPLTLLIWIYAERAQLQQPSVKVTLNFRVTDPTLTATLTEPATGDAMIGLSGPHGQIEQLRTQLDAEAVDHRLQLVLPASEASIGEKSIDLVRLLNDQPSIANSGVTVLKDGTIPSQVRVSVDRLVTRQAAVVKPGNLPQSLENVTFEPAVVMFTGPAPAMDAAFPPDNATVTVDLNDVENQLAIVGRNRKLEVPLVLPAGGRVNAKVQRVTMSFDLSSQEIEDTIASVPIEVRRPIGQDGLTKVVIGRGVVVLNNVHIRGPADKVRECVSGTNPQSRITAVLSVNADDRTGRDNSKPVTFINVPAGVKIEREPYELPFTVVDLRDSTPDR